MKEVIRLNGDVMWVQPKKINVNKMDEMNEMGYCGCRIAVLQRC